MAKVLKDIAQVKPYSKHEKPSAIYPLVRSPVDEKTETERARRVSTENWQAQYYYFNSLDGKRACEVYFSVLEDVRRTFNQREMLQAMRVEQDQRITIHQARVVFDELLRQSTLKAVAKATLNEQMEQISKNSMVHVFDELEKKHSSSEVTKEAELERQRRLDPQQWQRDHFYFSSPQGKKALAEYNDVLCDVRRIFNINVASAAMDFEQAQRQARKTLFYVLQDMLKQFSIQKVLDPSFIAEEPRVAARNDMTLVLEQLKYNACAKEISSAVEEERHRRIEEGAATRFVRFNYTVCQPFLPEIRRRRSLLEVC